MTKIKKTLFKFAEIHPETPKTTNKVTWADIILNALILAGLGFFTTLAGISITQIITEPKATFLAALISGGIQFFISLSIQRGLRRQET